MFCVNVQQLIKDNYLKIVWRDNPKHEGAQQLMQGNIAVKFEGSWPYDS